MFKQCLAVSQLARTQMHERTKNRNCARLRMDRVLLDRAARASSEQWDIGAYRNWSHEQSCKAYALGLISLLISWSLSALAYGQLRGRIVQEEQLCCFPSWLAGLPKHYAFKAFGLGLGLFVCLFVCFISGITMRFSS